MQSEVIKMEKTCSKCNKTFGSAEALQMHNQNKHPENVKKPLISSTHKKKIRNGIYAIFILGAIVGIIYLITSNITTLPPTTMQGHAEINPPSHIMKEPMKLVVHKHMLEHADGKEGGRGGVIINYNCDDFICEEGLIKKLEAFSMKYPEHVYVAPFSNMNAKIVLTKLNQQRVLEEYEEKIIDNFVS